MKAVAPDADARLQSQLQKLLDAMASIPPPFESAIQGADDSVGRTAIRATVASLRAQADQMPKPLKRSA